LGLLKPAEGKEDSLDMLQFNSCKQSDKRQNEAMSEATAHSDQEVTAEEEAIAPASDGIQHPQEASNAGLADSGEEANAGVIPESPVEATPNMADRIGSADSVEDFERLMDEVEMNPQALAELSDSEAVPEQNAETSEGATAPPEGEAEATPEAEAPEEAQDAEDEEVAEPESGSQKPPQFRFRPTDDLDAEAFRIYKAAQTAESSISMADAIRIAGEKIGQPTNLATATNQNPDQTTQGGEEGDAGEGESEDVLKGLTHAEAKQALKDLRSKETEAFRDGDLDEVADVRDQMSDMEDLIDVLGEREKEDAVTAQTEHDAGFDDSADSASNLFPDFANEGSDFYKRCSEIDEALKDTDDPRYYDADKPLMVAQMAAKELQIAPASDKRSTPAPKKAEEPQQVASSPQPARTEKLAPIPAASGESRTASGSTGATATLTEQLANIKDADQFDDLLEKISNGARL